ncbi:sigma-70 family RNA polymerase sigma factor [Bryocella elongata]|uniref:sigma-70 family RNA polymerase sigma factor n=1 Tax=Bryocella elongata TaxID=863522 RepID=UPI000CDF197A|nr:sigma-70 family RNA polymerase sigma factor [Bryocella elongata]
MNPTGSEVTALLDRLSHGDRTVIERLMPLVYDELRRRAVRSMREERTGHTLQPTALVHEAYLKLVEQREPHFANRAHFFAIASELMRRILVDHARARLASKRGGEYDLVPLDEVFVFHPERPATLTAVDDALEKLRTLDPRQEQIVTMRFFGGLTVEETAQVLGVSPRTVEREWTMARAWLFLQLREHAQPR